MSRIFLVGFMGVGKSTVGKKLASLLGYQFLDLDADFEQSYKISIPEFFQKYDEALFRKLEYEKLISSLECENVVISTGGGTACFFDSMDVMNNNGLTIYLEMPVAGIASRLINARKKRPLVLGLSEQELTAFIESKLKERKVFYEKAKVRVDAFNADVQQLAENISKLVSS